MAKPGRPRSPFVPTSFWAALFAPSLIIVAVATCWVAALILDFPQDVLDELDWGVIGGGLVVSFVYYRYRLAKNHPTRESFLAPGVVAEQHRMTWQPEAKVPALLVDAFGPLNHGIVRDLLTSTSGGEVQLGTFERHSADNDEGYVQDWGFLGLRLGRRLPNILLLASGSGAAFGGTGLGGAGSGGTGAFRPVGSQRLKLEGDFDEHFALYCPKGYESDALYLFTPDLMALLIDQARGLSVQLLDDALVFYSPTPIDYQDAALIARLFRIVDLVGAKALRASGSYRDDRAPDPVTVAPEGQRLQRAVPRWPTLVLWYSANVVLGVAIGALALGIRLGIDPGQWAARAQEPWLF